MPNRPLLERIFYQISTLCYGTDGALLLDLVYNILDEYDKQVADQVRMMVTDASVSSIQDNTRMLDAELGV